MTSTAGTKQAMKSAILLKPTEKIILLKKISLQMFIECAFMFFKFSDFSYTRTNAESGLQINIR